MTYPSGFPQIHWIDSRSSDIGQKNLDETFVERGEAEIIGVGRTRDSWRHRKWAFESELRDSTHPDETTLVLGLHLHVNCDGVYDRGS